MHFRFETDCQHILRAPPLRLLERGEKLSTLPKLSLSSLVIRLPKPRLRADRLGQGELALRTECDSHAAHPTSGPWSRRCWWRVSSGTGDRPVSMNLAREHAAGWRPRGGVNRRTRLLHWSAG
jgi:hypothetical protein